MISVEVKSSSGRCGTRRGDHHPKGDVRRKELSRRPIGLQFTSQRGRRGVWLMHEVTYTDGSVSVRAGKMQAHEQAAKKGIYPALKVLDAIWHDLWVTLEQHEKEGK